MIKDFQLSKNFTFYELTKTSNPIYLEQNRLEGLRYQSSLKLLATGILQPIRDYWQKPVFVSSNGGFRCLIVNDSLPNASKTSDHKIGKAADFAVKDLTCEFIFESLPTALPEIKFYKFILERKDGKEWLHISLPRADKENMQMMVFENGIYRRI